MPLRPPAGYIRIGYNPLRVPDAPTVGTATAGNEQISITFTAPSDVGGGAITSYIATARKTSDGTTISATGSSSPIIITGLTNDVAYTVTVVAVNSFGPGPSSAASGSATPVLSIGDAYAGGYYAGLISTSGDGVATHRIVVAPKSSGENSSKQWKTTASSTAGTSSVIDGPTNSANMNDASHPAAQFCEGLTIGGYSDWYLPATNELEVCYYNLKPTTDNNLTGYGANINAVPARPTNYTTTVPGRTSATDFRSTGSQPFASGNLYYWTSSEAGSTAATLKDFQNGYQSGNNKTGSYYARAIRRVAI